MVALIIKISAGARHPRDLVLKLLSVEANMGLLSAHISDLLPKETLIAVAAIIRGPELEI